MADISTELEEIELASRGEEVRDSIINAFEKLNSEGPGTVSWNLVVDTPTTIAGYGITDARANEAATEVTPAEAAHTTGSYLVYDGTLYRATAAIAIGDALTVGTNIEAVTIGEELQALAAADDEMDLEIDNLESRMTDAEDDLEKALANESGADTSPAIAAHSVGEYIRYQNVLYRVTAPIAIGDTLAVGTNIAAANLGGEVQNLAGRVSAAETNITNHNTRLAALEALGFSVVNGRLCVTYTA